MDKIIYRSVKLKCDPAQAFEMFTVNQQLYEKMVFLRIEETQNEK